jgi:arylsulfatase A-like enzyme
VNEAIKFIDKAAQNKRPYFTVIWFGSPHAPYVGLEGDLAHYREAPEALRARFAEITAMDRAIGQLRQHLSRAGLKSNTLLWYCGDNGVPPEGRLTTPFRGHKGDVYDGGLRVPCVIEWPDGISKARAVDVNAVTSDMLPTICDLTGQPLPERPLDGISLKPLLEGSMRERPKPICFWQYRQERETAAAREPYIAPPLQEGTTPTATLMDGKLTRSFRNFRYARFSESDMTGPAAILDNRHKLVIAGEKASRSPELFDLVADRGETKNLASDHPERVRSLERQLRDWQRSVLSSLTGADYK